MRLFEKEASHTPRYESGLNFVVCGTKNCKINQVKSTAR